MSDWLTPITNTFDNERIEELFTALTTVGEGRRVAAGLTCLAERHADNVRTDVVHTTPRSIILVISSHGGAGTAERPSSRSPSPPRSSTPTGAGAGHPLCGSAAVMPRSTGTLCRPPWRIGQLGRLPSRSANSGHARRA